MLYQLSYTGLDGRMVEERGFEPLKATPADLQSAPFDHSGTPPRGAGDPIRTDDLLITNQLLYQLSYTGKNKNCHIIIGISRYIVKNLIPKLRK
jgi:hypothetical protein